MSIGGENGLQQLGLCGTHPLTRRYMQWIGMFMKGLNGILNGFSWGIGFSVAIILSGLVYTKFVEPSLGNILEDKEIDDKAIEYLADFKTAYGLTLKNVFKDGDDVRLAVVQENLTEDALYSREVLASAFDVNGNFIGNCIGENELFIMQPKETSYLEIKCAFVPSQVEQIDSFKLRIKPI
ncbi:metal ABC transporter ATPase [Vibrio vulnificus]|uniref:metal ABC transporter ATPase n=1 Tax=Vibrio vulnificus TaxID=672 RepID=UPI0020D0AC6D|nr:metal ABC transporter ATPase [Vibrio vulnificus]